MRRRREDPEVDALVEAQARWDEENPRALFEGRFNESPLGQAQKKDYDDYYRTLSENGDGLICLEAFVAYHDAKMEIPEWLVRQLDERLERVRTFRSKRWEDAFGPLNRGMQLAKARDRVRLTGPVSNAVQDLIDSGTPVDDALFEDVASRFRIGKTVCKELYYGSSAYLRHRAGLPRT